MEEKTQIKIEEAKSWFVLAQILIILAGFMFATAGISHNNLIQTKKTLSDRRYELGNTSLNLNNSWGKFVYNDFRGLILDEANFEVNKSIYNLLGLGFIIISITFWILGKIKISRIKKN